MHERPSPRCKPCLPSPDNSRQTKLALRRLCVFVLPGLAMLLSLVAATSISAADWNQWRGPQRNGVAPDSPPLVEELPREGLTPLWQVSEDVIPNARGGGWSSPVVADGRAYLFTHKKTQTKNEIPPKRFPWLPPEKRGGMTDDEYAEYERQRRDEDQARAAYFRYDETVYCLDAETGKLLWKNERPSVYTRFAQSSSPAVIEGRVYVLGAGRLARCIDAVSGENLWETRLPGEFRDEFLQSSFAVADGAAVVLCGHLFGLDAASGEVLWEGDTDRTRGTHTSPAIWESPDGQRVVVNVSGGDTICVDPQTGRELWRVASQGGNATPVVAGNRLLTYGSSRKQGLRCFAITPDSAEYLWTFTGTADQGSSPVVVDGYVYVQGDRRLACVDLESGGALWSTTLDLSGPRYTSLVAADGKVFYAFDGVLGFAASPDQCRLLINGRVNDQGLLADEAVMRELLGIDRLEETPEGQQEARRVWRSKVDNFGPLQCASPAIADGKLFLRTQRGLAVYDLKATP